MSTYIIKEGHEYYDENEGDARGYPVKKWCSSGESRESHHEPKVGDSWIFEENGKFYRREVRAVRSNGYVWEDTESLDVEYSTYEIDPEDTMIDEKQTWDGCKYGIINGRKEVIVPYVYDVMEKQNNPYTNYAKVKKDGKWGVINWKNGLLIIPVECEDILWFRTQYAYTFWMCRKAGKWSLLDKKFKHTVPDVKHFCMLQEISEGKVKWWKRNKSHFTIWGGEKERFVGMVDRKKNIVIPFLYTSIFPDENRLLHVTEGDTNKNGEIFVLAEKNGYGLPVGLTIIFHLS